MNFVNQFNSYNQCPLVISADNSQSYDNINSNWTPFTAPTIWSPYSMSDYEDQSSSQSWSTFSSFSASSSSSASPYGSPQQTFAQYFHNNPPICEPKLPVPIARPTSRRPFRQQNTDVSQHGNRLPKRSDQVDMSEFIRKSQSTIGRKKMCTFCKSNGESEEIYTSHSLKNSVNKITCPILMKYTCVECGAIGENTHTIKYCPVMQKKLRQQMLSKLVVAK